MVLMKSNEPVREVVLIEEGPQSTGLAVFVRETLASESEERSAEAVEALNAAQAATRTPMQPGMAEAAKAKLSRPSIRIVGAPPDLASAAPGDAQMEVVRKYLSKETPKADRLDAVVFLTRADDGKPTARVWSASATDGAVRRYEDHRRHRRPLRR